MKLYKEALAHGWQLTTKHSFLWLFGLFALLISGNGGEYDIYLKNINRLSSRYSVFSPEFWQLKEWQILSEKIQALWSVNPILFIILTAVFLLALFLVIYFVVISQTSLIYAAGRYPANKISFHQCFYASQKYFWPVLFINIISKLAIFVFILLIAAPFLRVILTTKSATYESLYFLIALLLLIPVILIISFLSKYTINFIVLNQEKLFSSIKKAIILFGKNWLVSLEMALIIFILSLLLGLFIILGIFILIIPFITTSLLATTADMYTILMIAIFLLMVSMVISASVFSSWQWTSWTYLFEELTKGPRQGKLLRILQQ